MFSLSWVIVPFKTFLLSLNLIKQSVIPVELRWSNWRNDYWEALGSCQMLSCWNVEGCTWILSFLSLFLWPPLSAVLCTLLQAYLKISFLLISRFMFSKIAVLFPVSISQIFVYILIFDNKYHVLFLIKRCWEKVLGVNQDSSG